MTSITGGAIRVVIPTRDRTETAAETVKSVIRHAREFCIPVQIIVCDQSGLRGRLERFLTESENVGNTIEVFYIGEEQVARIQSLLATKTGMVNSVRFALEVGCVAEAFGSNRNLGILASAGRSFVSLDDDVVCRAFKAACLPEEFGVEAIPPWSLLAFASEHDLMENVVRVEENLISTLLDSLGPSRSKRIYAGDGSVSRADKFCYLSSCGVFGRSGLATHEYLPLMSCAYSRNMMFRTESSFESALSGTWCLRQSGFRRVAQVDGFISTVYGFWNEGPTVPFFPFGRGEDQVLSATMGRCLQGAAVTHLPLLVPHSVGEVGRGPRTKTAFPIALAITALLRTSSEAWIGSPSDLGRRLLHCLDCSETEWVDFARRSALTLFEQRAEAWLHLLSNAEIPDHVFLHCEQQMFGWIDRTERVGADPVHVFDEAGGLAHLRGVARAYGQLLIDWPTLWQAAEEIDILGHIALRI